MRTEEITIVANRLSEGVYDFSISDKANIIFIEFEDEYDIEYKYVTAVDLHADLFIDPDEDVVDYMLENGILAIQL